ncbi:MAG: hypothetical protein Q7V88_11000 [Actinomycetota bacterium]|nr:hypothetical protein [Actinomycetota bacterium]
MWIPAKCDPIRRRSMVALCLTLSVAGLASCDDEANVGGSKTPRITVDEAASDGSAFLLKEPVVRTIAGLSDVVAQDFGDVPIFENPDPRGPCGAGRRFNVELARATWQVGVETTHGVG